MYQNPTLFPAISNRETFYTIVQFADGDTGDLITLTPYSFALEIMEAAPQVNRTGYGSWPWDVDCGSPIISGSLANYLAIVDTGTLQISVPKSVIQSLLPRTYDVFLTITALIDSNDCRQACIGRLPVLYGGRNT